VALAVNQLGGVNVMNLFTYEHMSQCPPILVFFRQTIS
jgi:hypothetical protein